MSRPRDKRTGLHHPPPGSVPASPTAGASAVTPVEAAWAASGALGDKVHARQGRHNTPRACLVPSGATHTQRPECMSTCEPQLPVWLADALPKLNMRSLGTRCKHARAKVVCVARSTAALSTCVHASLHRPGSRVSHLELLAAHGSVHLAQALLRHGATAHMSMVQLCAGGRQPCQVGALRIRSSASWQPSAPAWHLYTHTQTGAQRMQPTRLVHTMCWDEHCLCLQAWPHP